MVEVSIAIHPIVAIQAGCSKIGLMLRHKGGLILGMAADTIHRSGIIGIEWARILVERGMAISAGKGLPTRCELVRRERETELRMRELIQRRIGEAGRLAAMLNVATHTHVGIGKRPVERRWIADLTLDVAMTRQTCSSHGAPLPGSRMARSTIATNRGVRGDTPKGGSVTLLCTQGARAKHRTTTEPANDDQANDGNDPGTNPKGREAAKAVHNSLLKTQQGCVVHGPANMHKGHNEERHTERHMDSMPKG